MAEPKWLKGELVGTCVGKPARRMGGTGLARWYRLELVEASVGNWAPVAGPPSTAPAGPAPFRQLKLADVRLRARAPGAGDEQLSLGELSVWDWKMRDQREAGGESRCTLSGTVYAREIAGTRRPALTDEDEALGPWGMLAALLGVVVASWLWWSCGPFTCGLWSTVVLTSWVAHRARTRRRSPPGLGSQILQALLALMLLTGGVGLVLLLAYPAQAAVCGNDGSLAVALGFGLVLAGSLLTIHWPLPWVWAVWTLLVVPWCGRSGTDCARMWLERGQEAVLRFVPKRAAVDGAGGAAAPVVVAGLPGDGQQPGGRKPGGAQGGEGRGSGKGGREGGGKGGGAEGDGSGEAASSRGDREGDGSGKGASSRGDGDGSGEGASSRGEGEGTGEGASSRGDREGDGRGGTRRGDGEGDGKGGTGRGDGEGDGEGGSGRGDGSGSGKGESGRSEGDGSGSGKGASGRAGEGDGSGRAEAGRGGDRAGSDRASAKEGRRGSPGAGEEDLDAAAEPRVSVDRALGNPRAFLGGEERVTLDGDLLFAFDEDQLRPEAEATLRQLARLLRLDPRRRVLLEGHADTIGGEQYNQELSERRARAVRGWLVEKAHISPLLIDVVGYGDARPVVPASKGPAAQKLNRRVEVRTFSSDPAP